MPCEGLGSRFLPPLPGGEGAGAPPIASSIRIQAPSQSASQPASSRRLAPRPACIAQDGCCSAGVLVQELGGIIDLAVPHKPARAFHAYAALQYGTASGKSRRRVAGPHLGCWPHNGVDSRCCELSLEAPAYVNTTPHAPAGLAAAVLPDLRRQLRGGGSGRLPCSTAQLTASKKLSISPLHL